MNGKSVLLAVLLAALGMAGLAPQAAGADSSPALEAILTQMDKAAASFKSAQADFVWDQYAKVVDETEIQKGVIYFRRHSQELEMAADIKDPEKYVIFRDGKVSYYQPRIDQVNEYNAGKNRADFESFLALGFGGAGHDLNKSFQVRFVGNETVDGINAAKLELTPKAERVRGMFSKIVLWIDPARGVSVRQQLIEPSGDYRLAKYSNIQINKKIDGDVFDLKKRTTPRTKYVRPNG